MKKILRQRCTALIVNFNSPIGLFSDLINVLANCSLIDSVNILFNGGQTEAYLSDFDKFTLNNQKINKFFSENNGYAAGQNLLASKVDSEYLLLINPDIITNNKDLSYFLKIGFSHNFDLLAPLLTSPSGDIYPSCRRLPFILDHVFRFVNLDPFNYIKNKEFNKNGFCSCDFLSGALWLVSGGKYNSINGFDERYFLYMEDIDFCRKLKKSGSAATYTNNVRFIHCHGDGVRKSFRLFSYFLISIIYYYSKGAYCAVSNLWKRDRRSF